METSRQRRNAIDPILMGNRVVEEPAQVKEEVFKHFKNLYSESWERRPIFSGDFSNQLDICTCSDLVEEFTKEEVWELIKSNNGNKAPGPDGFSLMCIKKCWGFMKFDFLHFFEEFYSRNGKLV